MKNQTLSFTVLAAVAAGTMEGFAQSPQSPDASKPNILFIITDQQSYDMMSCMGNKFIHTPHMDRLAKTGIRFDRVYCANPVSAPSRFTMFTGRHCSDIGTRGNRLKDYHAVKHTIADILKESPLSSIPTTSVTLREWTAVTPTSILPNKEKQPPIGLLGNRLTPMPTISRYHHLLPTFSPSKANAPLWSIQATHANGHPNSGGFISGCIAG